jgi:hypothetical protein
LDTNGKTIPVSPSRKLAQISAQPVLSQMSKLEKKSHNPIRNASAQRDKVIFATATAELR